MAPRVQSFYELLGLKPKASSSEPSVDFYSHQRAYNERQRQRKEARTRQREAAALQRETTAMQQNFSRAFFQDHPEVHITRQLRPQVECEEKEKAKPINISIIKAPLTPTATPAAAGVGVATPGAATDARRKAREEPKKEKVGNGNSGGRCNPQPVVPLRPRALSPELQLRAEIERLQRTITEHRATWKQAWDKEKELLENQAHLELELERLKEGGAKGGVEALKAAVNTQLAEVEERHQKARQHKDSLGKAIKTLEAALTSARNASVVLQANAEEEEEEGELKQKQKQEKKRKPWAAFKGLLRINKNKDEEKKQKKKNTKK